MLDRCGSPGTWSRSRSSWRDPRTRVIVVRSSHTVSSGSGGGGDHMFCYSDRSSGLATPLGEMVAWRYPPRIPTRPGLNLPEASCLLRAALGCGYLNGHLRNALTGHLG